MESPFYKCNVLQLLIVSYEEKNAQLIWSLITIFEHSSLLIQNTSDKWKKKRFITSTPEEEEERKEKRKEKMLK